MQFPFFFMCKPFIKPVNTMERVLLQIGALRQTLDQIPKLEGVLSGLLRGKGMNNSINGTDNSNLTIVIPKCTTFYMELFV